LVNHNIISYDNEIFEELGFDALKYCSGCEEYHNQHDTAFYTVQGNWNRHDNYYCEEWLDDHGSIHYIDGEYWHEDDLIRTDNNRWITQEDYENNYFTCDSCGEVFHLHYACSTDYETVCEGCYTPENRLHSYSTNILSECGHYANIGSNRERLAAATKKRVRLYGLELEVTNGNNKTSDFTDEFPVTGDNYIVKEDGSVDFELNFLPATLAWYQLPDTELTQIAKYLNSNEYLCHNKAGIHVHINRVSVSTLTMRKVDLLLMNRHNRELFETIAQRQYSENKWCSPQTATKALKKNCDLSKYRAVNYAHAETYELRIFNSSNRIERIIKNVEFTDAIISYAELLTIQQAKDLDNTNQFIRYVETKKKLYPNLVSFLIERNYIKQGIKKCA
jgi:hypothetical protein